MITPLRWTSAHHFDKWKITCLKSRASGNYSTTQLKPPSKLHITSAFLRGINALNTQRSGLSCMPVHGAFCLRPSD